MNPFNFSETGEAVVTLAVVAVMFVLFMRERYPAEVVAIAGASAMLALGVLPYEEALHVLSNPAPWTIVAMFIVMGRWCGPGRWNGLPNWPMPRPMPAPRWPSARLWPSLWWHRPLLTTPLLSWS